MRKISLLTVLVLIGGVILSLLPLFQPGLFDVHDPTSAFRLYTLVETIKDGQFPASWSNELNFGFGYPLHLYYAPLFTYIGSFFKIFISSYEIVIKLLLVIISLTGAFGVYRLMSKYGRYPAFIASSAFIFLPYRASALYVRGSYSEFLAMSLIPWLIYYWLKPQRGKRTIIITAVFTALFVLSHNTLHLLILPIIILIIALYQRQNILGSLVSIVISIGLSAWFIAPVFFERNLIKVETLARITNFEDHFITLSQLWYSPWGYGGSSPGLTDLMSFMIGKGQVVLGILGFVYLLWNRSWKNVIILGSITLIPIYLSLTNSSLLWQAIPFLSLMQFPWRSLSLLGVGISTLAGFSLLLTPSKLHFPLSIIIIVLLISTNIGYFKPQEYRTYNQEILANPNNLDSLARDKFPEYLPSTMPSFPDSRIEDKLERTATRVFGTLTLTESKPLTLSTAYMPHWRLAVEGQPAEITPTPEGLVTTVDSFEPGVYEIELSWHRTLIEQIANIISALSLLVVIGLLLV